MLYRGSEILNDVGWVIFDEIHCMKDGEKAWFGKKALSSYHLPLKWFFFRQLCRMLWSLRSGFVHYGNNLVM